MKRKHFEKGPSPVAKKFIKFLKWGDIILDAGCGGGMQSYFFAQQGFETWGIDVDAVEVKRARENFQVSNLHFQVAAVEKIPFEDKFFDGIYCAAVLHNIPLERPAREIFRVAKEGAVIFLEFPLTYVSANITKEFHTRKKIEEVYAKYFHIFFLEEVTVNDPGSEDNPDVESEPPHRHEFLVLGLVKDNASKRQKGS